MEFILNHAGSILLLIVGLLILALVPIVVEIWRTVRDVRLVADRVAMLTDISGWFSFFKKFRKGCCK